MRINFDGADWKALTRLVEQELNDSVDALKNPAMDERQTQFHRGRVDLAERILSLPNHPDDLEAE